MRCFLRHSFQPMIEPRDLVRANGRSGIVAETNAGKCTRHVMRPGTNHDAVFRILFARLMQRRKGIQVALDIVVVPAAHRKHGHVDAIDVLANAAFLPERIISRMFQDGLVQGQWPGSGGGIGSPQRQVTDVTAKFRLGEPGRGQVLRQPEQTMPQLHGAARRIEPVQIIVAAGDHRKDRLQVRVIQKRHSPLCDSQIRSADHPHFAVRPRLRRNPVERVVSVRTFLVQSVEHAFGVIAAAHILHHNRVPVLDKGRITWLKIGTFSIRRSNQDGWVSRATGRMKDVGVQMNSVAHRNAHV